MFTSLTRKVVLVACFSLIVIGLAATYAITKVLVLRAKTEDLATATVRQIWLLEDFNVAVTRTIGDSRAFALGHDQGELAQAQGALAAANTAFKALDLAVAEPDNLDAPEEQEYIALYAELRPVFADLQHAVGTLTTTDAATQQSSSREIEALEEDFDRLDDQFSAALTRETDEIATTVSTQAYAILLNIAGILVMSSVLIIAALVLLRRYIIQPIQMLSAATTAIIAGNLNHTIATTSADEIGALQGNFNAMTARIRAQTNDLEQQIEVANDARTQAEHIQVELADQLATIESQRVAIREMSVPILPVTAKTMVMPLVGELDSERLQLVQEQALQAIAKARASHLILDITGVPVVDTYVAQGLVRVVQASRLLGTKVVLVGVRPEVAQSLVGLGVDLAGITTYSTLQSGLLAVS